MIGRIFLPIILLLHVFTVKAQDMNELKKIIEVIKESAIGDISIKCIDLDNDEDNDYLFTYSCGEPNCFEVFLTINGKLVNVIKEFGNISFYYENSIDFKPSHLILNSNLNHCCGESPFTSFRQFVFKNDQINIIENYVRYNHEDYCHDDRIWDYSFLPTKFLSKSYIVRIIKEKTNIRFSADLKEHNAEFVCIENSNIIGQLKLNSEVTVLAEKKGEDSNMRTWLYVEINKSDLDLDTCDSPLTYDFKQQKLRGWISDKNTIRQY